MYAQIEAFIARPYSTSGATLEATRPGTLIIRGAHEDRERAEIKKEEESSESSSEEEEKPAEMVHSYLKKSAAGIKAAS